MGGIISDAVMANKENREAMSAELMLINSKKVKNAMAQMAARFNITPLVPKNKDMSIPKRRTQIMKTFNSSKILTPPQIGFLQ